MFNECKSYISLVSLFFWWNSSRLVSLRFSLQTRLPSQLHKSVASFTKNCCKLQHSTLFPSEECFAESNFLELFSSYLVLLSSSNKSSDFPRSKKESIEISKLVWTSPTRQSLFGKSLFDLTLLFAIAKSFFCCVRISLMTSLTWERSFQSERKQGHL